MEALRLLFEGHGALFERVVQTWLDARLLVRADALKRYFCQDCPLRTFRADEAEPSTMVRTTHDENDSDTCAIWPGQKTSKERASEATARAFDSESQEWTRERSVVSL